MLRELLKTYKDKRFLFNIGLIRLVRGDIFCSGEFMQLFAFENHFITDIYVIVFLCCGILCLL